MSDSDFGLRGENMQDKKSQYRSYLIVGLVITFLLVGNITYTNARGEYPATLSSIQHESKEGEAVLLSYNAKPIEVKY